MAEKTVTIKNKAGIHCRPSSAILSAVEEFPETVFDVESARGNADLSSILGLLSLGLQFGEDVTVKTSGENEEDACEKIAGLFEYEFDFPQD